MYGIILAGGSGSRLWPLSRELYPKQLLNLVSNESLLQTTFERLNYCMPKENIVSATNSKHVANVRMQLSELTDNPIIIGEPVAKNTAPAIITATKYIMQKSGSDPIIIAVPSDLLIKDNEKFAATMKKGEALAEQGYIVTFGIKPNYPETGYGYINTAEKIGNGFEVKKFIEKPDYEKAAEFTKKDNFYWNSGIFMFKASTIMEETVKHAPEIAKISEKFDFSENNQVAFVDFDKMPNISIDYAVMEKSDKIALIELESDWYDIGSWQAIYNVSPKDENGNVFVGHVLDKNSKNSFVYASSKLVTTIGLEDTVIVETEDAILACKKDKTQEVKQVYETLKQQNDNTHLVHKTVYRPWGFYTVIAQGDGFLTKIIHVNPGQKLSVQSHNFRSEHWVILSGTAKVVLEGKELILSPGHSVDIPLKAIHSLQNPFDKDIEIIEVQKGDPLIEEDIIRYEDMYGRA